MALDTATKSNKKPPPPQRSSFDKLMDLYWGGTERRITGLTLRIIGINALCVITLMIGILNFSSFERKIINKHVANFATQGKLIEDTLNLIKTENIFNNALNKNTLQETFQRLRSHTKYEFILRSDDNQTILAQTITPKDIAQKLAYKDNNQTLLSLSGLIKGLSNIAPNRNKLPRFPLNIPSQAPNFDLIKQANSTLMAWKLPTDQLLITATVPIKSGTSKLTLFMIKSGQDIVSDIQNFWRQIFTLFLLTLSATTTISIYISGSIARPLRRLTQTAELIRRKKNKAISIPDLSNRHDEIGELSLVLKDMTESLWERLDAIENFSADVAHELKNPLTSLKSALETLQLCKTKKDKDSIYAILHHDIERMDRLVTDISQASRLDAALAQEKHDDINLNALLKSIIERYQQQYKGQFSLLLFLPQSKDITVNAHEGRLIQVIDNIIDNAISFSPKGGTISITAMIDKSETLIMLDDEGPGIPVSKLTTIFERFYSERRHDHIFGKHSGLGLAICKQIIEALGGKIYAQNRPYKQGARFTIRLP